MTISTTANVQNSQIEALKQFAESNPLKSVKPYEEISSDRADTMALDQYAKEHGNESAAPPILEDVTKAAKATPLPNEKLVVALEKDGTTLEIEKLLESGLGDTYAALPDNVKPFFKDHGEKIAKTAANMIAANSFDGGVVMDMVEGWLTLIPKSSAHYLQQEAKLKTDALMKYATTVMGKNN